MAEYDPTLAGTWDASVLRCGRTSDPKHPHVANGTGSGCLICALLDANRLLRDRAHGAADLLHEGKVVQAHELLESLTGGEETTTKGGTGA